MDLHTIPNRNRQASRTWRGSPVSNSRSSAQPLLTTAIALAALLSTVGIAGATETTLDGPLRFRSEDGKFAAQIGGRIQQDWAFVKADDDAKAHFGAESIDGTEFRRARLSVNGKMFGNVLYKAEYDFVNSIPDYRDVYIELTGLPFGSLRVGNFYEQFCLEEMTSDNYITLMERSAVDLFAPGRNPGIMARNTYADSRGTWALGVYRQDTTTTPGFSRENGAYAQTGRITFLPIDQNDGRRLVHLGLAASHRRPPAKTRSYSLRPPAHLANDLARTGSFAADRVLLLGGEAAWVEGPLSIQAEAAVASHAAPEGAETPDNDPTFTAFYLQGSYFVTGEHRRYKRSDGAFDRIAPNSNFGHGSGALQLAARVSHGDLEDPDHGIAGGTLTDFALGANLYLNAHTRVMVNYVLGLPSRTEQVEGASADRDGTVNVLQTRFAIDF